MHSYTADSRVAQPTHGEEQAPKMPARKKYSQQTRKTLLQSRMQRSVP